MNIDRSVIWLRVKASDDVESSPNVGRNFQRQATFPLRCTRELQMLSLSAFPATVISCKLPSSPFLACHSAVVITGIHINFVKPKRSQMFFGNNNLLRMVSSPRESPRGGQWSSPLQVRDQCRPMKNRDSRVVWHGLGKGMLIYVRDHSDMVGTRHVRIDWFGGQLVNIGWI